ncbi:MAG: amino acid adenylation domain-containing protein [Desulfobacteraceae bacterium]|nr:amino acid adenylation domain-containing protein [Desulfobacteraceae bacterium]
MNKNNIEQNQFWIDYLYGFSVKTEFPYGKVSYKEEKPNRFSTFFLKIENDLKKKIYEFLSLNKLMLSTLLFSSWGVLLQKYNNANDVVFGTACFDPDLDTKLETNIIPLRVIREGNENWISLLEKVDQDLKIRKNYEYIYMDNNSPKNGNNIRNNLFTSNFAIIDHPVDPINMINKSTQPHDVIWINCAIKSNEIELCFCYPESLYTEDEKNKIGLSYSNIVTQIVYNPSRKISSFEIISELEKNMVLREFNRDIGELPPLRTIHQFIEHWSEKTPDKTAVIFEQQELTYREINEKSNQVARYLLDQNIRNRKLVAVLLERSPLMVIAILGIWKSGNAYVPIDPQYPLDRTLNIMQSSRIDFIFTRSEFMFSTLTENYEEIIYDFDKHTKIRLQKTENPDTVIHNHDLAYVIYTSGSTGKPKGVMIEYAGMMNHIQAKINDLNITGKSIIAQNASHCFDISVWQFFCSLVTGGKTVIYSDEIQLSMHHFLKRLIQDHITILELVPSYLSVVLDILKSKSHYFNFPDLDFLLVTGEELKAYLVKKWFSLYKIPMVNVYGPTEASDDITHHFIEKTADSHRIPIGKPISNMNIYIVDKDLNLCPPMVKGELCVTGIGVGRGYLNSEKLTQNAFIENPFFPKSKYKLYKTGDLARWSYDGTIEFFGRMDRQVKIHGFRIELDEIENALSSYEKITNTAVLMEESKNKSLCAYYSSNHEINPQELKNYLLATLPSYMIPSQFIHINKMPLTVSGKIDRKALLKAKNMFQNNNRTKFIKIFHEILDNKMIEFSSYFRETALDSLKYISLVIKVEKTFNMKFDDENLLVHNFEKVEDLYQYVTKKISVTGVKKL